MTTINFSGIGTGMDIHGLVDQLVAAERAPMENRINRKAAQVNAQLSALGQLKSVFGNLQSALGKLSASADTPAHKATVPEGAGFSASAGSGAVAGRYAIEVVSLAQAHKLASGAHDAEATFGGGVLTVEAGGDSHRIEIAATDTLSDIAAAINAAAGGKGVTAGVVNADDGQHLVLNATGSGSAGALRVTVEGDDGLAWLAHDPDNGIAGLEEVAAPADAVLRVDGFERTASSNTVDDLVPGITLSLDKARPGETFDLRVQPDHAAVQANLQAFVVAYNNANAALRSVSAYDPVARSAAALTGDAMVRGLQQQMRGAFSLNADGLAALGVSISTDGALSLDSAKFASAMAEDPAQVAGLFGEAGAIASGLDGLLTKTLDADSGTLSGRTAGLDRQIDGLSDELDALDRRMEAVEARYLAQFIAMDTLVAQMQGTSSYLAQQLEALQAQLKK